VREGGVVIYDTSVIETRPDALPDGVRVVGVPFTAVAKDLGSVLVKSVVALGALQGVTRIFPKATFLAAIRDALRGKGAMVALDEQAFERGVEQTAALEVSPADEWKAS
jgi:2-oxoglutarate ferredoxin oxidoreductase subunit alpha